MPSVPSRDRPATRSPRAPFVLLVILLGLAAGCGPSTGGDLAKVDVKKQKELNKLLTSDYSQMYREKYQKKPRIAKVK